MVIRLFLFISIFLFARSPIALGITLPPEVAGVFHVLSDDYCICHASVSGEKVSFNTDGVSECMKIVAPLYQKSSVSGADLDNLVKDYVKESENNENKGKVCSKKQIKFWVEKVYKKGQAEAIDDYKAKIEEKYCGLKAGEPEKKEHEKCFDRLAKLINDDEVKSIKQECSENNLNKTKKTKKNCVEIEKSKYILDIENDSEKIGKLYPEICKKTKDSNDICLDGVTKETSKVECSDLVELTTKESQNLCRKLTLAPLLTSLENADKFKTCTNGTSDSKEKAACFAASGAKSSSGGNDLDDILNGIVGEIKHVFDKSEAPDTYSHTPVKEITGETNLSETDKTDFKSRLKGKISDDQIRLCTKAYKKGMKEKPDASFDEAKNLFNREGCDIEAALKAAGEGGNACYQNLAKYDKKVDKNFFKKLETACEQGATEEDTKQLVACYDSSKKEQDTKKAKKVFDDCVVTAGLDKKFDVRDFMSVLKDEFEVSGCEKSTLDNKYSTLFGSGAPGSYENAKAGVFVGLSNNDKKIAQGCFPEPGISSGFYKDCTMKAMKNSCITGRVGQELMKATLAELAKEGGMIGALASVGLDVTSCIPPKGVKTGVITNSRDFCEYLKAGWNSDSQNATESRMNECYKRVTACDKYKDPKQTDIFQACGMKIVSCVRKWSEANTGSQDINFNEAGDCDVSQMDVYARTEDRGLTNPNTKYQEALCIAGAALSGVNAITSAICANKKKYPTAKDQDECLRKMRVVNELAQAGASTANCMKLAPADKNDRSPEAESKRLQMKTCLTSTVGNQAVDAIASRVCNNESKYPTPEAKDKCMRMADLAHTGLNTAAGVMSCGQIMKSQDRMDIDYDKQTNSDDYKKMSEADQKAARDTYTNAKSSTKKDYNLCLGRQALDTASDLLMSQVCRNKPDDKGCKAAATGLKMAGHLVNCANKKGEELKSCMVTQGLNALGEVPGPVGEVAKIAAAGIVVMKDLKNCNGDQLCTANVLAQQLPGDAKIYVGLAIQGRSLLKQKNPCKVPSKYLYKAGQLTKLGGDLATAVVHKVEMSKLKRDYGDLVEQQESEQGSGGLYGAIDSFVKRNNDKRDEQRKKETEQQFANKEAANDAQLRGLEFARRNEEMQLKKFLWDRPFLYTSAGLNMSANTMAVFESMAETTADTMKANPATAAAAQGVAPWLECERTGAENKSSAGDSFKGALKVTDVDIKSFERKNNFNIDSIHASFNGLSNKDAYAQYIEWDNYFQGKLSSLSVPEYNELERFNALNDQKDINLAHDLAYALDLSLTVIPRAEAFDAASLVNIGVTTAGALFPGKGGFEQGTPMGYAEDITMLFVRKGMEKACPPEDPKTPEKTFCKMQGAIDFAARKAAQALLKANQTKVNNFMKSGVGRGVIGVYNATNLIKLIKQNEEQIKGQRERVEYMRKQEADMKSISFLSRPIEKPLFNFSELYDRFIMSEAHASTKPANPDNLKVCINKQMAMDYACNCKSTGCYEVFPSGDKNFQRHMDVMNKKMGKTFKDSLNPINSIANNSNQVLNGTKGTGDIPVDSLKSITQRLEIFTDKLMSLVNGARTKAKMQPVDLKKQASQYNDSLFSSLPKEVREQLNSVNIASIAPKLEVSTNKADTAKVQQISPEEELKIEAAADEEVAKVEQDDQEKQFETMMRVDYEYTGNDVQQDKELNLFKIISTRYTKKMLKELNTEE